MERVEIKSSYSDPIPSSTKGSRGSRHCEILSPNHDYPITVTSPTTLATLPTPALVMIHVPRRVAVVTSVVSVTTGPDPGFERVRPGSSIEVPVIRLVTLTGRESCPPVGGGRSDRSGWYESLVREQGWVVHSWFSGCFLTPGGDGSPSKTTTFCLKCYVRVINNW